ncbi:phosphoadenosine phosphosulfate reductase family protein [Stutzerimonas stutzeri]|uniref:Phosphoadenosine phosphosulphate reductase domain-containing protein n=1 Tax=Stutzerimonas stutzeri TaxID=316 RepID=A0A172WS49_STUST|nr:phosphoadenosine phosphosulfate reductase family protein [Stutzerimonas stutzeri]ANF26260.1 hypothetical protein PS273GM_14415 [Stutzerimonas stutzeri]HAB64358.1 phosphoadenosine phosphosulfate reductase [Pseudomonas sp.]
MEKIKEAIRQTQAYFTEDRTQWIVGYSGGKDSSLVIKILLAALKDIPDNLKKELLIFYCDTGVEIPTLKNYITDSLAAIEAEGRDLGIAIRCKAVTPDIANRYFVKVIGRGYPPPTNKFRWCTDKLRIDPIQSAIKEIIGDCESIVVLGTRYEESAERDRILDRHSTEKQNIFLQSGHRQTKIFCPIAKFTTDDVWAGLVELESIKSINLSTLSSIYRSISGECPIIKLPDTNPCSKGRFGCWTCTVIRKDKATKNLILNGQTDLQPLYDFREWLLRIRDLSEFRCLVRRNGAKGLGAFRVEARRIILKELLTAEKRSGFSLISKEEISAIEALWHIDENNLNYCED